MPSLLLYGGCSFDENECRCAVEAEHICRSVQAEVFSIVCDQDGATVFMDPNGIEMFKQAVHFDALPPSHERATVALMWWLCILLQGMEEFITVAPQKWRAIQVNPTQKKHGDLHR